MPRGWKKRIQIKDLFSEEEVSEAIRKAATGKWIDVVRTSTETGIRVLIQSPGLGKYGGEDEQP